MSCVIGYVDRENKKVWMGADSRSSNSLYKDTVYLPKVFRNDRYEDIIIGTAGSFRNLDLLRYAKLIPEDTIIEHIDHKFMVNVFIPNLMPIFQNGVLDLPDSCRGVHILIGIQDRLFNIQEDYSVMQYNNDFLSIGSGDPIARGSLFTTKDMDMSIPTKIELALRASSEYAVSVGAPYTIINSLDSEVITIK